MSLSLKKFVLFLGAASILASCSDKTKLTAEQASKNLVAKEKPSMIMSVAAKDILEKSGMADGSVFPMTVKMMFGEMLSYVTESDKTGIELGERSYVLTMPNEDGSINSIVMVYTLANEERFAKMIEEDTEVKPAEKGNYKYVISPDNTMSFSWYKSFGLCIINPTEERSKESMEKRMDELMTHSVETGEVSGAFADFFDQKTDFAMMFTSEGMMKLAKASADQQQAYMEEDGMQSVKSMDDEQFKKLMEIYEGSYTMYTVSFETDKIAASFQNNLNDKAKKELAALVGKGIAPDMLNFLSNDQLLGFFSLSVSAESLLKYMTDLGGADINTSMEDFKAETGISMSDIVSSFSGDITMSFAGMKDREMSYTWTDDTGKEQTDTWNQSVPVFNACFGIKNNLIRTIADTAKNVKKEGNIYKMEDNLYLTFLDNKMFLSSEEAIANQVATGGSLKPFTADGIEKKSLENPVFGYFDFKALAVALGNTEKELQKVIAPLDHAVGYGDHEKMVFELNFRKSGKNGLFIITKSIMDTYFNISF